MIVAYILLLSAWSFGIGIHWEQACDIEKKQSSLDQNKIDYMSKYFFELESTTQNINFNFSVKIRTVTFIIMLQSYLKIISGFS